MKKVITLIILLNFTLASNLFGQDFSKLKETNLSDSVSCINAQPKVIECCEYLLNTPCVENLQSLEASLFIVDWMGASSNFTFSLDNNIYSVFKSDNNLTARYYAALSKVALEKNYTTDCVELQLQAITELLNYCELPNNKVKITKKLQKYIDAKNSNHLRELIVV